MTTDKKKKLKKQIPIRISALDIGQMSVIPLFHVERVGAQIRVFRNNSANANAMNLIRVDCEIRGNCFVVKFQSRKKFINNQCSKFYPFLNRKMGNLFLRNVLKIFSQINCFVTKHWNMS